VEIEQVTSFTYLGFIFTPQLRFTQHLELLNTKASSKCGLLLSKIYTYDLPLHVVLALFNCYILPTYRYGLNLWLGRTSQNSIESANAVFTKYLKRYLGIPFHSNNSITHFITNTEPLSIILKNLYPQSFNSLSFPTCLNGLQLSRTITLPVNYNPLPHIPSYFWRSKYPGTLPIYSRSRKVMCEEIYDVTHYDICINPSFHLLDTNCICMACGDVAMWPHIITSIFVN